MHLAGAGIKAWLLLTSPLAGVPMVTQEGSLPDHARSHILILAIHINADKIISLTNECYKEENSWETRELLLLG